jgi:hypothetical protein
MFPVYDGKCLSRKALLLWWQMFSWWRRGWNGGAEVAETTVKRLLCCRFRSTGKVMGQVYQCWWRMCREIIVFFSGSNIMFYVLYQFVAHLLTVPRIIQMSVVKLIPAKGMKSFAFADYVCHHKLKRKQHFSATVWSYCLLSWKCLPLHDIQYPRVWATAGKHLIKMWFFFSIVQASNQQENFYKHSDLSAYFFMVNLAAPSTKT